MKCAYNNLMKTTSYEVTDQTPLESMQRNRRTGKVMEATGALIAFGGIVMFPAAACAVDADTYNVNRTAILARENLHSAILATTGEELVNRDSRDAAWGSDGVDSDTFSVRTGEPDMASARAYAGDALAQLEKNSRHVGSAEDVREILAKPVFTTGELVDVANAIDFHTTRGEMIDSTDMMIFVSSVGAVAAGVCVYTVGARRREAIR